MAPGTRGGRNGDIRGHLTNCSEGLQLNSTGPTRARPGAQIPKSAPRSRTQALLGHEDSEFYRPRRVRGRMRGRLTFREAETARTLIFFVASPSAELCNTNGCLLPPVSDREPGQLQSSPGDIAVGGPSNRKSHEQEPHVARFAACSRRGVDYTTSQRATPSRQSDGSASFPVQSGGSVPMTLRPGGERLRVELQGPMLLSRILTRTAR